MRKVTIALLAGLTALGAAAPAAAQHWDRDRDGVSNHHDRNDDRPGHRWNDPDRDGVPNRYDRHDYRGDRGFDYRRGWAYDDRWTPYGWGYHDRMTREWVLRNYADRNRNGRISEGEWRRAQRDFYRLADRNRDGRIDRREYNMAMRYIGGYRY